MDEVYCPSCGGHYILKDGTYGDFAGCSNFPKCRSTLPTGKFLNLFLEKNGINIYKWEKRCWKCKKTTTIFSYYLHYQLSKSPAYDYYVFFAGIGYIFAIDKEMANRYKTIKYRYSSTSGESYYANTCEHCGSLQGRNYVVDDPHEIGGPLMHNQDMSEYFLENISLCNLKIDSKDLGDLSVIMG